MTTPFPFTTGQVLTAAQMNAITTLPINDQTASYTLVVGDVGKRVIMNVASANTVTVNNSIFSVGDTINIVNKGAGVSTVTAGAGVTINTSDSLALAQYQSGSLVALSASSFLFFPTTETAPASGLTVVKAETAFTSATSITADNVFTSSYTNYLIVVRCTTTANAEVFWALRVGGVTAATNYNYQRIEGSNTTLTGARSTSQTKCAYGQAGTVMSLNAFVLSGPNLAEATTAITLTNNQGASGGITIQTYAGNHTTATAYDGIELTGGTATGTYTIYGLGKS